ncbi:FAD-dependent monooxygenase [Streptomyces sp. SKN60]|uniref:FAD-dependent monooxygenase n=1 Tax=Streptomyces sp. SKN60 TaxID=2855506 RepID=UPI002245BBED|nr:FAD-dependent monooxygenase [Streptomyces sp. SKN60]MCX2181970.1 FAD-dependent monooxygenase [Streptomyces sp. SKN60]
MSERAETAEVIVAGAGPTGLTLACELALAGVRTLVIERLPERVAQMKGGSLQPRTQELFELRGLLEPMKERALTREPGGGGHFALLPVPLDYTAWDTAHPHPLAIPQGDVEAVLEERALSLGVTVLRDTPVTAVAQSDEGVVVTAGGRRFEARYLMACDGGHSTVRKLLDVPFPGRPGTYTAVLADVRLKSASEHVPTAIGHASTLTRYVGEDWVMLVPAGGDRYRFTSGRTDGTDAAKDRPVTFEEIAAQLRTVYGEETVLAEVAHASRFGDATRQIESYRVGNVFFAGDAAHIHPPFGGQGLNLGVQDAFNLGWKAAAVLRGRAPAELLDTYHAERHPAGAWVVHITQAQRVFADPRPAEDVVELRKVFTDLLRLPEANRHLAGQMSGLAHSYELPGGHPLAGHRAPGLDPSLFHDGRPVLLDTAGILPTGLGAVRAEPAAGLPGALLVRPDGYIAWAADSEGDADLATLTGDPCWPLRA